jgi:beta-lactamase class A
MRELDQFISERGGKTVAVAFHDLETGAEYFACAEESFHAASTMKVAVMAEVFHQAAQGKFSLDDEMEVVNSFPSLADGSLFSTLAEDDSDASLYEKVGKKLSLRELNRLMIVRSSNLATNILIQLVGARNVQEFLHQLGVEGITILRGVEDDKAFRLGMNNTTTARGLMQLFLAIAEGRIVSQSASDEMICVMLEQEYKDGIAPVVPAEVRVASKSGWSGEWLHDAGIVFPPRRKPYILVVLTKGYPDEASGWKSISAISNIIYRNL